MKFTYRSGQRPLEGYTLKRGVGHGGFGEVYFALSDGGKEVALKLIRGHSDIELRGVSQCLNFKHPHLVHLYDLRTDPRGDRWLVMEYILGEPLSAVLARHPHGLPSEQTREWFAALARAVGYLHDHGVVHRDLKPANLFLENGVLKVGDYGLCKSISSTSHHPQTQHVGTVHYMAPEVGKGQYNKSVDIYACGVILYEMLTGTVPFDGETVSEVLLKHLTDTPNLDRVPAAFRGILAKALAKNPLDRYHHIADMAREVETTMAKVLAPTNAPMASKPESAAVSQDRIGSGTDQAMPNAPANGTSVSPVAARTLLPSTASFRVEPQGREKFRELTQGMTWAALLAAPASLVWAAYQQAFDWAGVARLGLLTVAVTWGVLLIARLKFPVPNESLLLRLLQALWGIPLGLLAFWLDGWMLPQIDSPASLALPATESYLYGWLRMQAVGASALVGYVLYFATVLGLLRWWKVTDRQRSDRFTFFPPIAAGFWSLCLLILWPTAGLPPATGVLALVLAAFLLQIVSPWVPPPAPLPRKLRLAQA